MQGGRQDRPEVCPHASPAHFRRRVCGSKLHFSHPAALPSPEDTLLRLLGSPRRCCDGLTRRETLRAGALTALGGLSLPHLLAAESSGHARPGKAKSVIVLYL